MIKEALVARYRETTNPVINAMGVKWANATNRVWPLVKIAPGLGPLRILSWGAEADFTDGRNAFRLKNYHARALIGELRAWEWVYVPKDGVKGKTVLSIGAGCGEDDWWFRAHGAKKVVAIDSDPEASRLHRLNADRNGWDSEVICKAVEPSDFDISHDFLKVDAEQAGDAALLAYDSDLGPCRMELHPTLTSYEMSGKIIAKHGLRYVGYVVMWGRDS